MSSVGHMLYIQLSVSVTILAVFSTEFDPVQKQLSKVADAVITLCTLDGAI